MSPDPVSLALQHIDAHLAQGNAQDALHTLRQLAGYPHVIADWCPLAAALARIAGDDFPDLARAATRLQHAPADLQALYDTGYHLFELGAFELAAALFARAEAISPGVPPVLSELSAALEELGCYADATRVLLAYPHLGQESLLFAYLLAFNAILSGQLGLAREQLPLLTDPADENEAQLIERVRRMLARADFIHPAVSALDTHDLRGWHAVLTGGALLHLSPHGFPDPMRGRYAAVQDSPGLLHASLHRLRSLLRAFSLSPERVLLLPERGSEALGLAAACLLEVPAVPFAPQARGLVVAYDLDHLPHPAQVALRQHRPGQHLWAHAACWTAPPICAPDVVSFLYQSSRTPWEPPWSIGETAPSLAGRPEELAEAILRSPPDNADARPEEGALLWAHLAEAAGEAEPALRRDVGFRERLWFMGPVHSRHLTGRGPGSGGQRG